MLVEVLKVLGSVLSAVLRLEVVTGTKHNLDSPNFEPEVTELLSEESGLIVSKDLVDSIKVLLHEVC